MLKYSLYNRVSVRLLSESSSDCCAYHPVTACLSLHCWRRQPRHVLFVPPVRGMGESNRLVCGSISKFPGTAVVVVAPQTFNSEGRAEQDRARTANEGGGVKVVAKKRGSFRNTRATEKTPMPGRGWHGGAIMHPVIFHAHRLLVHIHTCVPR